MPVDARALEKSEGTRRFGFGLRIQIIVALTVAFIASFTLLGIASVRLTQHARMLDRTETAEAAAYALASALGRTTHDRQRETADLCDAVIGRGGIAGVEVEWPGLEPQARGLVTTPSSVDAPIAHR